MRGKKLHTDLFVKPASPEQVKKGRSERLIEKRNECLIARYYYYTVYRGLEYENIIRRLVSEFFLSAKSVIHIINSNTDLVKSYRERELVLHFFQKHWPYMRW